VFLAAAGCSSGGDPGAPDAAGAKDATKDQSTLDVASDQADDAPSDAARAGTALQTNDACATLAGASNLSLSNDELTIELWLRLDAPPADASAELEPILWKGGRATSEPGWSLDVGASGLVFCVASDVAQACTTPYALSVGHLVHVGVRSTVLVQTSGSRAVTIYARDVTSGETAHTAVASMSAAPNAWNTSALFTIGGADACANAASFTIDDLRIFTTVQTAQSFDAEQSVNIACTTTALAADYAFDEGSGSSAADCSSDAFTLALGAGTAFVPSPFP
jgi:hypothetical protein